MANSSTEQIQSAPETPKRGRGRPPESDPTESHTLNVRRSRWQWLSLWAVQGASKSKQFEFLCERLENVYPEGPGRIGRTPGPDAPKKARQTPAVACEAARRGMSKAEFINELYADYKARNLEGK